MRKGCTGHFRKWFDVYQSTSTKTFLPLKSWINEYAKANDFVIKYYDTDFGFLFTLFTKDEYYVRKG